MAIVLSNVALLSVLGEGTSVQSEWLMLKVKVTGHADEDLNKEHSFITGGMQTCKATTEINIAFP